MTDIVDRLRAFEEWLRQPKGAEPFRLTSDVFDKAADEIERLRAALRGIIEADCEAIKMNDGVVCLKPGPYAVIARAALGEEK